MTTGTKASSKGVKPLSRGRGALLGSAVIATLAALRSTVHTQEGEGTRVTRKRTNGRKTRVFADGPAIASRRVELFWSHDSVAKLLKESC